MQLGSMFICNCNIAVHVWTLFASIFRSTQKLYQQPLVSDMRQGKVSNKASKVDGIHTLSHVTHQRLLLQFLSAPEDGRKKRPKHVEQYCNYIETYCEAASRWFFLYILSYDARKPEHKIVVFYCGTFDNVEVTKVFVSSLQDFMILAPLQATIQR